jgi:hypothetical protein
MYNAEIKQARLKYTLLGLVFMIMLILVDNQ